MRDIGRNIRDLRTRKGMTQEELAGKLFVTRQTVSNYETGKTRPDVDLIVKIADALDTDANTVFYGPPVPESRKSACRRLLISSAVLLVLAAAAVALHLLCDPLKMHYRMSPFYFMKLVFDPALALFAGWWLMNGIGFILKENPLTRPWVKKARIAAIIVFILCEALVFPLVIWMGVADMRSITTGGVQMTFPYIPVYQEMMHFVVKINMHSPVIYALLGILLWLFGAPKKPEPEQQDAENTEQK